MGKLKTNTKKFKILNFIFRKGSLYKQDLLLYADNQSKGNGTRLISNLQEEGYIFFKDFSLKKKGNHKARDIKVAFLTEKGFNNVYLIYRDEYPKEIFKKIEKRFNTIKNNSELLKLYNENHIKTLFNCAGIQTEPFVKPTLKELSYFISGIYTPGATSEESKLRKSIYSKEEIKSLYERGIYYTSQEFRTYLKETTNDAETISSVFRGLFLSSDKCLVVYSNGKNNSAMIYQGYKSAESKLLNRLSALGFIPSRKVDGEKVGLYALTISDTNTFVYAMASGRKNGKGLDIIKQTQVLRKEGKRVLDNLPIFTPYSSLLNDMSMNYFNGIYSVVHNKPGVESLRYLVSHSIEAQYKEFNKLALSKPDHFEVNYESAGANQSAPRKQNHEFPFYYRADKNDQWKPCIYLPVIELTLLKKIENLEFTPVIVTSEELAKLVQHITHKEHVFLDLDLNPLNTESIPIYNDEGEEKGKKMLESFLHNQGLDIDNKQYRLLPASFNQEYHQFYNSVSKGEIKLDSLLEHLELKEYVPPVEYKRPKYHQLCVSEEIYNTVKQYSVERNITLKRATALIMKEGINEIAN